MIGEQTSDFQNNSLVISFCNIADDAFRRQKVLPKEWRVAVDDFSFGVVAYQG